jgi:hypothetical protein
LRGRCINKWNYNTMIRATAEILSKKERV